MKWPTVVTKDGSRYHLNPKLIRRLQQRKLPPLDLFLVEQERMKASHGNLHPDRR